jgi:hypothetical protein
MFTKQCQINILKSDYEWLKKERDVLLDRIRQNENRLAMLLEHLNLNIEHVPTHIRIVDLKGPEQNANI